MQKEIKPKELIYGELTHGGINKLIELVRAIGAKSFIDVGSGYGKIATAINQELNIKSYGIEIDKDRFKASITQSYSPNSDKLKFYNKDFRDKEMLKLISETDFVFSNCLVFDPENAKILFDNCKCALLHNNYDLIQANRITFPVTWSKGSDQTFWLVNMKH